MPARAPGLRARASAAPAVALPCPSAQRPEAMAMENPAAIGTTSNPPVVPPCAKSGVANDITDSAINKYFKVLKVRMVFLLTMNCRQWVVDVDLGRKTPSRCAG